MSEGTLPAWTATMVAQRGWLLHSFKMDIQNRTRKSAARDGKWARGWGWCCVEFGGCTVPSSCPGGYVDHTHKVDHPAVFRGQHGPRQCILTWYITGGGGEGGMDNDGLSRRNRNESTQLKLSSKPQCLNQNKMIRTQEMLKTKNINNSDSGNGWQRPPLWAGASQMVGGRVYSKQNKT